MNPRLKSIFLLLCLGINYSPIFAQAEKGGRLLSYSVKDVYFKKYDDSFNVKAELTELSQVQNKYPEQLLQSVLSSNSFEWDIYNTLGGKEKAKEKSQKHYSTIKTMDRELNYFKPLHKMEFEIEGVPVAIIKYNIVSNNLDKTMSAVMVMRKINDRWYITSTQMVGDIALTIWRLKTAELEKIIKGDESDSFLKEIKFKVFINGVLDIKKLSSEIDSWYVNNNEVNKAKIKYFKDPLTLF